MTSIHAEESQHEQYSLIYANEAVAYQVVRQAVADTAEPVVTVRVHPNTCVDVVVPDEASSQVIDETLQTRAKWIFEALGQFQPSHNGIYGTVSKQDSPQFYLGRRYILAIAENAKAKPSVKLLRGQLVVTLKALDEKQSERVKHLIAKWYKGRAERIVRERLKHLHAQIDWLEVLPEHRILPMRNAWGACATDGALLLNPNLVKAPKACIDYVILDTLCRLHDPLKSESLLAELMPTWEDAKQRLVDLVKRCSDI